MIIIDMFTKLLQEVMCLRKVLAIGTFALEEIRHRVKSETIDTHLAPVVEYLEYFLLYERVIIVKIRLMKEEAVPVELLSHRVPCPVGAFKILEDDAYIFILL